MSRRIRRSSVRLQAVMSSFGVLTNRKRAVIALVHSIVFLGVAAHGFASPKFGILRGLGTKADIVLAGIYVVVATILIWLVSISPGAMERTYFALCATSATSGLVRTLFGDQIIPPAQYLRVLMLTLAVVICIFIVRGHSRSPVTVEGPELSTEISPE